MDVADTRGTSIDSGQFFSGKDFPMKGITVQRTVELHSAEESWYSRVP